MFISIEQLGLSLSRLEQTHSFYGMSFLIFMREQLPVGMTADLVLARLATEHLDTYYKASVGYEGYYTPFQSSSVKSRWVKGNYNHTTLQRITTETFRDALIHPKNSSEWGWQQDYVDQLQRHLGGARVPAFDLAVWLFRSHDWPTTVKPTDVVKKLLSDFRIRPEAVSALLDTSTPALVEPWLSKNPITERQLLRLVGFPPGSAPEEGAALEYLHLRGVGPASRLDYEPSERLNIITGDNSLGKTFLLECIWWALTGGWLEQAAIPKGVTGVPKPGISFGIKTTEGAGHKYQSKFNWATREWSDSGGRKVLSGLVIYARHDGSFAVWDPAKLGLAKNQPAEIPAWVLLDKRRLWDGYPLPGGNSPVQRWLCNGLVNDWVLWQLGGKRYEDQFAALTDCLKMLSPSPKEPLEPGNPSRVPGDTRETPTLKMPYGEIPVQLASAGVQRVIGVAYVLVWAWFEHLANSETIRKSPQRRLVFLIDEAEAHLHPRWQRVIVPALTNVLNILSAEITPQVHLATHSPMVMASTETIFDAKRDDLHHLRWDSEAGDVSLEELPFVKRGTVDQWLISNVFELQQARSVPAEEAIEAAKALQEADEPDAATVAAVNERLTKALAPDDEFWPRWRYFAKQHGVKQ